MMISMLFTGNTELLKPIPPIDFCSHRPVQHKKRSPTKSKVTNAFLNPLKGLFNLAMQRNPTKLQKKQ